MHSFTQGTRFCDFYLVSFLVEFWHKYQLWGSLRASKRPKRKALAFQASHQQTLVTALCGASYRFSVLLAPLSLLTCLRIWFLMWPTLGFDENKFHQKFYFKKANYHRALFRIWIPGGLAQRCSRKIISGVPKSQLLLTFCSKRRGALLEFTS